MDDAFRVDGEHLIDRLPSVARACPASTPPAAALQIDVELRVDWPRVVEASRELVNI